jgi:hypothetical protein
VLLRKPSKLSSPAAPKPVVPGPGGMTSPLGPSPRNRSRPRVGPAEETGRDAGETGRVTGGTGREAGTSGALPDNGTADPACPSSNDRGLGTTLKDPVPWSARPRRLGGDAGTPGTGAP